MRGPKGVDGADGQESDDGGLGRVTKQPARHEAVGEEEGEVTRGEALQVVGTVSNATTTSLPPSLSSNALGRKPPKGKQHTPRVAQQCMHALPSVGAFLHLPI